MNIIFVSHAKRHSLKVNLKPFALYSVIGMIIFSGAGLFYSGYYLAQRQAEQFVSSARTQTQSIWQQELTQQEDSLADLRLNTEKSLDAMAGRLSTLQGYIMRLDALGSRLADMADLDDMEFGEQTSPEGKPSLGGYLSSVFGYRTDPMSGNKEFHEGLDFAGREGTPVVAVAAGIITWSGKRYGFGNMIEISHGNGYITRYAHNNKNLVSVGEKVERGEVIATMGNTGRSTGTHVHFEVIYNGRHVDPRKYLSSK
jgi:murein DD-endopeptidase MepM/ murein hydrolase activator NlpD